MKRFLVQIALVVCAAQVIAALPESVLEYRGAVNGEPYRAVARVVGAEVAVTLEFFVLDGASAAELVPVGRRSELPAEFAGLFFGNDASYTFERDGLWVEVRYGGPVFLPRVGELKEQIVGSYVVRLDEWARTPDPHGPVALKVEVVGGPGSYHLDARLWRSDAMVDLGPFGGSVYGEAGGGVIVRPLLGGVEVRGLFEEPLVMAHVGGVRALADAAPPGLRPIGSPASVYEFRFGLPFPERLVLRSRAAVVADSRVIALPAPGHVLSPTEGLLLSGGPEGLFAVDIETGSVRYAVAMDAVGSRVLPESAAWADGAARIVVTEDFFRRMLDPDLHVIDFANDAVSNLTEDGESSISFSSRETPPLDLTPLFAGGGILYQNMERTDWGYRSRILFRPGASAVGDAPVVVGEIPWALPSVVNLFYSPADGSVYLNSIGSGEEEPETGVFLLSPGGNPERIVPGQTGAGFPLIVDISLDGRYLLITYPQQQLEAVSESDDAPPTFVLFDVTERRQVPLAGPGSAIDGSRIHNAAFSPDGRSVVFVGGANAANGPEALVALRDVEGGPELVVYESEDYSLGLRSPRSFGQNGIGWDTRDQVFVSASARNEALIIQLRREP